MQFNLNSLEIESGYFSRASDLQLVLAGGRAPALSWLKQLYAYHKPKIYCADGGIKLAEAMQVIPELLLGDEDSADSSSYKIAELQGVVVSRYPIAKDDTDLGLVLARLADNKPLLLSGCFGGRLDHLYANIYTLLGRKQPRQLCLMADEQEVLLLLEADESVKVKCLKIPKAISLLCLEDEATVSLDGVKWPLEKAKIKRENAGYTVSNELDGNLKINCCCHEGKIGLYFYFDCSDDA